MKQKVAIGAWKQSLIFIILVFGTAALFYYLGYEKGYFVSEGHFYDDQAYALPKEPAPQLDKYFDTKQYLFGRWEDNGQPHSLYAYRINNTLDVYDLKSNDLIGHYTWGLVRRPENPNGFYILLNDSQSNKPRYYLVQKIDQSSLQLQNSDDNSIINFTRQ